MLALSSAGSWADDLAVLKAVTRAEPKVFEWVEHWAYQMADPTVVPRAFL